MYKTNFELIAASTAMRAAGRYSTRKAITAMILLARQNKGIVEGSLLSRLFDYLKINKKGRDRAIDILEIAFSAEGGAGVYYIPDTPWNIIGVSHLVYNSTKSGSIVKRTVLSHFIDEEHNAGTPEVHKMALETVALRRANLEFEAKYEEMYHKWADSVDDNKDLLEKTKDLSNRLTRLRNEATSFTNIILGMTADDDDAGSSCPAGAAS